VKVKTDPCKYRRLLKRERRGLGVEIWYEGWFAHRELLVYVVRAYFLVLKRSMDVFLDAVEISTV